MRERTAKFIIESKKAAKSVAEEMGIDMLCAVYPFEKNCCVPFVKVCSNEHTKTHLNTPLPFRINNHHYRHIGPFGLIPRNRWKQRFFGFIGHINNDFRVCLAIVTTSELR